MWTIFPLKKFYKNKIKYFFIKANDIMDPPMDVKNQILFSFFFEGKLKNFKYIYKNLNLI